jgi:hypothetical protein
MRHTAYTSCYMQHTEYTAPPFSRRARTDADRPSPPVAATAPPPSPPLVRLIQPAALWLPRGPQAGCDSRAVVRRADRPRRCSARAALGRAGRPVLQRPRAWHAPPTESSAAHPHSMPYVQHTPNRRGMRRTARRSLGSARRRRRRRGLFGWCWWAGRGSLHAARTRLPQRRGAGAPLGLGRVCERRWAVARARLAALPRGGGRQWLASGARALPLCAGRARQRYK